MILDQRFPWMWVLGLGLLATGASPQQMHTPLVTDPKFIEECVNIHNELRERVSPEGADLKFMQFTKPIHEIVEEVPSVLVQGVFTLTKESMTWDTALAKTARAWSKKCIFRHNTYIGKKHACHPFFKNIGENLWMGDLTEYVPKLAVTAWYNEGKHFDIGNNACSGVCGHFTQVVWAETYKIGCALRLCPNLGKDIAIFVCNYAPPGNLVGRKPYTQGNSCTACAKGDICENRQCRNTTREQILSYPYWNPSWEFPRRITCNPFCQTYVIIRLVGLAGSVLCVFVLQIIYPGMHLEPNL